jgi:hypothetical protein
MKLGEPEKLINVIGLFLGSASTYGDNTVGGESDRRLIQCDNFCSHADMLTQRTGKLKNFLDVVSTVAPIKDDAMCRADSLRERVVERLEREVRRVAGAVRFAEAPERWLRHDRWRRKHLNRRAIDQRS